jgi:hypothetical protein
VFISTHLLYVSSKETHDNKNVSPTIGDTYLQHVSPLLFIIGDVSLLTHISYDGDTNGDACLEHKSFCFSISEIHLVNTHP